MVHTLSILNADSRFRLTIIVTGSHLSSMHGMTVREIETAGFNIGARIPVPLDDTSRASVARNVGGMLSGMVDALEVQKPDLVLLLGDRGEMLAAAIAAAHLSRAIVHIHGGERSGTIDESVRHAISKLAHHHLVATRQSASRLIRMGEEPSRVAVVGAPGLDGIDALVRFSREQLCARASFNPTSRIALFVLHPVLYESDTGADHAEACVTALKFHDMQVVAVLPNSDAGGNEIRRVLIRSAKGGRFVVHAHLARDEFISWMACCDVMVGNSSSGILEAASFGTPVVNIGSRQMHRERSRNVIDAAPDVASIQNAISRSLRRGRRATVNVYGDGQAGQRIADYLASADISLGTIAKVNAY